MCMSLSLLLSLSNISQFACFEIRSSVGEFPLRSERRGGFPLRQSERHRRRRRSIRLPNRRQHLRPRFQRNPLRSRHREPVHGGRRDLLRRRKRQRRSSAAQFNCRRFRSRHLRRRHRHHRRRRQQLPIALSRPFFVPSSA